MDIAKYTDGHPLKKCKNVPATSQTRMSPTSHQSEIVHSLILLKNRKF